MGSVVLATSGSEGAHCGRGCNSVKDGSLDMSWPQMRSHVLGNGSCPSGLGNIPGNGGRFSLYGEERWATVGMGAWSRWVAIAGPLPTPTFSPGSVAVRGVSCIVRPTNEESKLKWWGTNTTGVAATGSGEVLGLRGGKLLARCCQLQ